MTSSETVPLPACLIQADSQRNLFGVSHGKTLNVVSSAAGLSLSVDLSSLPKTPLASDPDAPTAAAGCVEEGDDEGEEKKGKQKKKKGKAKKEKGEDSAPPVVRAIGFGSAGIVVCGGDDKMVRGFDVATRAEVPAMRRRCPKRVTAISVDVAGSVVFSDKFGDVFRFSPAAPAAGVTDDECALGHCSMLTCMALSPAGGLIATGDRDEKVRVSKYPASYDIVSYCLGHTASVMGIAFVRGGRWLVSGGADGTLRSWNPATGEELSREVPFVGEAAAATEGGSEVIVPVSWHEGSSSLAVIVEGRPAVWLYNVAEETGKLELRERISTPSPPICLEFTKDGNMIASFIGSVVAIAPAGARSSAEATAIAEEIARRAPKAATRKEAEDLAKSFERSQMKRVVWAKPERDPDAKRQKTIEPDQPEEAQAPK